MGYTSLAFFSISRVYDPDKPLDEEGKENTSLPAPKTVDGMFSWLRKHPYLTFEKSGSALGLAEIGGASGWQYDAVVSSVPKSRSSDCSSPCVALFRVSDGSVRYTEGERCRFFIVDVSGEMVVLVYSGPPDEFSKFEPAAHVLLDTVEWIDE